MTTARPIAEAPRLGAAAHSCSSRRRPRTAYRVAQAVLDGIHALLLDCQAANVKLAIEPLQTRCMPTPARP